MQCFSNVAKIQRLWPRFSFNVPLCACFGGSFELRVVRQVAAQTVRSTQSHDDAKIQLFLFAIFGVLSPLRVFRWHLQVTVEHSGVSISSSSLVAVRNACTEHRFLVKLVVGPCPIYGLFDVSNSYYVLLLIATPCPFFERRKSLRFSSGFRDHIFLVRTA